MHDHILQNVDPDVNLLNDILPSFTDANNVSSDYFTLHSYNDKFNSDSLSCLSVLNCNVRSFNANGEILISVVSSMITQPQVLVLTETWLTDENRALANIVGYKGFHTIRGTRGGGVSIYIHDCLSLIHI